MVPPKGEHVVSFLDGLRLAKDAKHRLNTAVDSNPQAVIDFIELLPPNWENQYDDDFVDELRNLELRAKRIIKNQL